ncbi:MAG: type II secretion system protein [Phycisphaeraceae bacterium]|nr:type II secretion system protein [Phycisphaeraceae bacterium]
MTTRPGSVRAFTLIEAAVSTVIVAVMIVAALQAVGSAAEARRRSADLRTADDLIEWTLAEIASVYFEQPLSTGNAPWGPDPGEKSQPRDYNDIDDYHGLTMSPPIDRGGQIVSAFAGWKCDIVVLPVRAATDGWVDANAAAPLRLVEVTVRSSRGVEKLGRLLLSRQGTRPFDPNRSGNHIGAMNLTFRPSPTRSHAIAAPLLNAPEVP